MSKYTELTYLLASLYYRDEDIDALITNSGHRDYLSFIGKAAKAVVYWTNIISYYEMKGTVKDLLKAVLNDGHSDNEYIKALLADSNTSFKGPFNIIPLQPIEPVAKRELEKLTQGKSTLLPISFLEEGLIKAKSVARVVTDSSLGSGFLLKNNYFLTNNHVIDSKEVAETARIELNYQNSAKGALLPFDKVELNPHSDMGFYTSFENDWTIVKLKGFSADMATRYGYLELNETKVKKNDFVNIIQHPGGEAKQIALYHNMVVAVNDERVQYLTDTLAGSSGSPVFDTKWNVVALHHAGGNMQIVGGKENMLVNEGININIVAQEIRAKGFKI